MTPPVLSIKNLSKSYASGLRALKDINLEIHKGEIFSRCSAPTAPARPR